MGDGIYAALSGALAHQTALDVTANNLANASTRGYRAERPVFHELVATASRGEPSVVRLAAVTGTTMDASAGAVEVTNRALDLALGPATFLAVRTQAGERYTRAASLEVGPDGTLLARGGAIVLSEAGKPIQVASNATVRVTEGGEVLADDASVGFLRLVSFADPGVLGYEGANLLAPAAGAATPTPSKEPVHSGQLEQSNASPVRSMSDLLLATRMFEAMQRAISTFRDADRQLVSQVPK